MSGPTPEFWQQRFESRQTPWDRSAPGPQIAAWLADGTLQPGQNVLVPGCGSGWDVLALARAGLRVTGLDYAAAAVEIARERLAAEGLAVPVRLADVLDWEPADPVDAVYEQTCLCALHPDEWTTYAAQLHRWLRPGGRLLALFMQTLRPGAAEGFIEGPPYHCDIHAMRALFPSTSWDWPRPPYARVPHPMGIAELAVVLTRR
ncbi:SAM-dependent methyltransferase [Caldimonas tepidiphila]|uniref:SAM-dependent methyltransferase n=1 Tax=Caldimonas tepidiphila TaxID=2315841 RepID=UPI000E5AB1EF|nr:methyltransferase domain-containing protein [Caldimonas tepidiphila]